jgi:hypothetical protein
MYPVKSIAGVIIRPTVEVVILLLQVLLFVKVYFRQVALTSNEFVLIEHDDTSLEDAVDQNATDSSTTVAVEVGGKLPLQTTVVQFAASAVSGAPEPAAGAASLADDHQCPICYGERKTDDFVFILFSTCNHYVCSDCFPALRAMRNPLCPMCRVLILRSIDLTTDNSV